MDSTLISAQEPLQNGSSLLKSLRPQGAAVSEKKPFNLDEFVEVRMNSNLEQRPESVEGMDCVYQFEIGDKVWNLDLLKAPPHRIERGPHPDPDCTLQISAENFEKMLRRQLNVPLAFITGKIKVKGDKLLATKLTNLFK